MKVKHPSGEAYDLLPNTEIEFARYNPFFHELGEQSLPFTIPASQKNLDLLSHPHRADNFRKPLTGLDVQIESGTFNIVGRQAILSAQEKGMIETSIYLHEGAFYEKIEEITLSEIFKDKKITFSSVDDVISFMYSLVSASDARFAIFPVQAETYKLNALSDQTNAMGLRKFINEVATEAIIDEKKVTIPKAFFMTPFVKVRHVLSEVLLHLGYTLGTSFLDNAPFNEMVFLNNNIDTLVDNSLNYIDIVPNITVKELFNVIRKFNVELIPDEHQKIVNIINFNDVVNQPSVDISDYAVSKKIVNYHGSYRQLKLSSEMINSPLSKQTLPYHSVFPSMTDYGSLQQGTEQQQGLYLFEILNQYPSAYFRKQDGAIVRDGFQGDRAFIEKITGIGLGYYAGGPLKTEDHTFPDVMPDIKTELKITYNPTTYIYTTYPYIDSSRSLRSKIVFDDGRENEGTASDLKAMLCLLYRTSSHCVGVLNNYDNSGNKLWNNSILWYGEEGIFEKFWRQRDSLLRNALLDVKLDTILPEDLKLFISPVAPLLLHNQKYLLSEMQYSTQRKSVSECSLLSTKIQEPISAAKPASEYFRVKTYRWDLKVSQTWPGQYRFVSDPVAFYPPDPTPAQYAAGGQYHGRNYNVEFAVGGTFDNPQSGTIYVWLEPVLV